MEDSYELRSISDKDKFEHLLKKTQILFRQQKYTEAKRILQEILSYDKGNAVAYNNLGSIYLIEGRLQKAESFFKKALELDANLKDAKENLKTVQRLKKRKTEEELKEEIALLEKEAQEALKEENIDKAIEKYEQILDEDPTNIKVYNNLGILFFQKDEYEKAERCFVKALEIYFQYGLTFDEQYTIIRQNLAKMRQKVGFHISDTIKGDLKSEISKTLTHQEEIICSLLGEDTQDVEKKSYIGVFLTNKRLIMCFRKPYGQNVSGRRIDLAYRDINSVKLLKGILRSTLILDTVEGTFSISSKNFVDVKRMHIHLSSFISHQKKEIYDKDKLLPHVLSKLLEIFVDIGVFTQEEVDNKLKEYFKNNLTLPKISPFSPIHDKHHKS